MFGLTAATLGTLGLILGLPALIGGIGNLFNTGINGAVNYGLQKDSQNFNAAEAEKQRNWQSQENEIARNFEKEMSSTAFSRQVADMKNAGLNPGAIGAGASGAFTPSASVGSGYAASSSAGHVGMNDGGLNGYLNNIVSQAAFKTIRSNPESFGNACSQAARMNANPSFYKSSMSKSDYPLLSEFADSNLDIL